MPLPTVFSNSYSVTTPTTLRVTQSYWSWFKSTGRGYTITELTDRASASPLFTVETRLSGKYRVFRDREGTPLCRLQRNFLKRDGAWVLTRIKSGDDGDREGEPEVGKEKDEGEERLFTVSYDQLRWKMTIKINGAAISNSGSEARSESGGVELQIKSVNLWGSGFTVVLGDQTVMKMRCTNMMHNAMSSFKVTPPRWEVELVEGMDSVLAATIAVVISDSFSEMHIYMV
ncbi:hypothetical protein ASPCAL07120 [Aspergillus calidoustus]|uniref:Tubby C-terminal domain-containing protein n=1 Tax=Aspergillus calidoustus TaxID=454130 RepID=A0A0U5G6U2_ASPCI|nr:hypothetical protein ASPCAL07120 [Aspergillus calidoustus]